MYRTYRMPPPEIGEKLKRVPKQPGVYLLKNADGKTIYVGKAKALRERLRSHFRPGPREDVRHRLLMAKVAGFETVVTDSEIEALILEANFIKEHHPKYNVNLKDDKSYPYIRVTHEPYPRVVVSRRIVRDGSRYFGPYTDVGSMRQLLAAVRRIFPVRTCGFEITEDSIRAKKHKVCLMYHIRRCGGPCVGMVGEEDYRWTVREVVAFIQGKNSQLKKDLETRMSELAACKRFEEAAQLRDEIRSIAAFQSRQKVVDGSLANRDIVVSATEGGLGCGLVFNVRDGKIVNRLHFILEGIDALAEPELTGAFVKQYYVRTDDVPEEVLLPVDIPDAGGIAAWLAGKRGGDVRLSVPKRGKQLGLMGMCRQNARLLLEELLAQKDKAGDWLAPSVQALARDLRLPKIPRHIEAFDVSNLAGADAVASLVVFENGKPKKSEYRKFRIRRVGGIDDFAMMAEVVDRRIGRLQKEQRPLPDLILVDGGKGQLSAALGVLARRGFSNQPIVGLAKRLEEVFVPGASDAQTLPKTSASLRLLQRVRNEAHRFAVQYHRTVRKKRMVRSELDDIPGIGPTRRNALLRHFGSLQNIREAAVDQIAMVKGMNIKAAQNVAEFFRTRPLRK